MKRKRRKFTKEFKEAVKLVLEQGYQISEASRNLGIHANLLGRWKREYEDGVRGGSDSESSVGMRVELN
jgi:transposase